MLYPKENESRAIIDLDGIWKIMLDEEDCGFLNHWEQGLPKEAQIIAVPASYNDQKEERRYRNHYGWAFYERDFIIPAFYKEQRLVLRFDGVTHNAEVYLNGTKVLEHRGGFLPFETEITDFASAREKIHLIVAVDNRVNSSTLPVGNESGTSFLGSDNAGIPSIEAAKRWTKPQNLPNFDFFNYCGINRHVRIYTTPKDYIENITIVTQIEEQDGIVMYQAVCKGKQDVADMQVKIKDTDGNIIACAKGMKGCIRIKNANLWWPYPDIPYLYTAVFIYGEDVYEQTFGIRMVEVKGTKFFINKKPFYLKGFGKHEDSFFKGRGTDTCLNVKDISLLHWIHANSFRTSHYPYAEEMYDLCDREGIVIIDETPAVGIGSGVGKDSSQTLLVREHHEQVIRDLICRDKNHPSVIMWSLGNEPDTVSDPKSAYEYWHSLYQLAHECDPCDRPVTMVCCQNDYTKDITTKSMDVVCLNRYYGWYNLSGDLEAACYALNLELDFWKEIGKPVMITEYGCDTIQGYHLTVPEMWSEEYQVEYLRRLNDEFDKRSFLIGEQVWNFADFGTIQGVMRADGNRKGIFTRDRRPKMAAHYLKKRWSEIENFGYKK